jgi:hypothetical protein
MKEVRTLALTIAVERMNQYADYASSHRFIANAVSVTTDKRIRSLSDSDDALAGFRADTAMNAKDHAAGAFQFWHLGYHDVYSVDLRRAESMAKTLKGLHRKLDAETERSGPCEKFGHLCARIANAIGAKHIIFQRTNNPSSSWDDNAYDFIAPGLAVTRINRLIAEELAPAQEQLAA